MFANIAEFKRANEGSGHYWFSPDTMRFFNSKVHGDLITIGERQFFITSEQGPHQDKPLYSIREAMADATVDTIGEFQGYPSVASAKRDLDFALKVTS